VFKHYLGIAKGKTCQGNKYGVMDWCKLMGVKVEVKPEVPGRYMMIVIAPKDCEIKSFSAETFDELMEKAKEIAYAA